MNTSFIWILFLLLLFLEQKKRNNFVASWMLSAVRSFTSLRYSDISIKKTKNFVMPTIPEIINTIFYGKHLNMLITPLFLVLKHCYIKLPTPRDVCCGVMCNGSDWEIKEPLGFVAFTFAQIHMVWKIWLHLYTPTQLGVE